MNHRALSTIVMGAAALFGAAGGCGETAGAGGSGGAAPSGDESGAQTGASGPQATGTGVSTASGPGNGSSSSGPPPNCAASTDCQACGEIDGCGWCGATSSCVAGNALGPTDGACDGGWAPTGDLFKCFAAECASHTDCESCDSETGCGFCLSSGKCIAGSTDGPADGWVCADLDTFYYSVCPSQCASKDSCVECGHTDANGPSDDGCGWCGASSTCMPGNAAGPILGNTCAGNWSINGTLDECL